MSNQNDDDKWVTARGAYVSAEHSPGQPDAPVSLSINGEEAGDFGIAYMTIEEAMHVRDQLSAAIAQALERMLADDLRQRTEGKPQTVATLKQAVVDMLDPQVPDLSQEIKVERDPDDPTRVTVHLPQQLKAIFGAGGSGGDGTTKF